MRIRFSRDLTLRKGVKVNVPLMDKWSSELNEELENSGLREKYDFYQEANNLNQKNICAQTYIGYLQGIGKNHMLGL